MSGGKGGGDTQEVQVKYPGFWSRLTRPTLEDLGGIYGEQAAAPLHPYSEQALAGMAAEAQAGSPLLPAARGAVGDVIGGAGLAAPVRGFAEDLVGGGFVNPAFGETQRIAMGGDVGTNPYLEATYERAARPLLRNLTETVNPSIDIGAASSGRLGSGMHALLRNRAGEQTGEALTDLATGLYGGAYETERGRQMGALGQLGSLGAQDVQQRLAGAGLYDVGTARALQASGMAPAIDQTRFSDAERLMQIGEAYQGAPWMPGERYLRSLYGLPGAAGGSTTTQPGMSPLGGGASGALGGAALASLTGFNPWIGAGLGLAGGFLSDERAKTDIEPAGITFGGTPVYKFRYRDEFGGGPMMMGVLAQDVAEEHPEAVMRGPDGLLRVLYEYVD